MNAVSQTEQYSVWCLKQGLISNSETEMAAAFVLSGTSFVDAYLILKAREHMAVPSRG